MPSAAVMPWQHSKMVGKMIKRIIRDMLQKPPKANTRQTPEAAKSQKPPQAKSHQKPTPAKSQKLPKAKRHQKPKAAKSQTPPKAKRVPRDRDRTAPPRSAALVTDRTAQLRNAASDRSVRSDALSSVRRLLLLVCYGQELGS